MRKPQSLPTPGPPEGRIVAHEREEALVQAENPNQTAHHLPPRAAHRAPAPCLTRGGALRKTRTALSRQALSARTGVTARHKVAAPACLAPGRIHQPVPPTQARLPIERGMHQRLMGRTAEFSLNSHMVNVAVLSLIKKYTTPPCNVRQYHQGPNDAYASCSERQHPEAEMQCIPEAT
jgi:hypothetical protein